MFESTLDLDPWFFVLGMTSDTTRLTPLQVELAQKLLFIARKCILIKWIHDKPPSIGCWYDEIFKILPFERLNASLRENEEGFQQVWAPFLLSLPDDVSGILEHGQVCFRWSR